MRPVLLAPAALAVLALSACDNQMHSSSSMGSSQMAQSSGTRTMHVSATPAQEVPPVMGNGSAMADLTVNPATKVLMWKVTYSGLSSEAKAAHIHGPAEPGANAGVIVNLAPGGMKSPLEGQATLTDAQLADMMAGKYYINLHTANNPNGEVRGQIR